MALNRTQPAWKARPHDVQGTSWLLNAASRRRRRPRSARRCSHPADSSWLLRPEEIRGRRRRLFRSRRRARRRGGRRRVGGRAASLGGLGAAASTAGARTPPRRRSCRPRGLPPPGASGRLRPRLEPLALDARGLERFRSWAMAASWSASCAAMALFALAGAVEHIHF